MKLLETKAREIFRYICPYRERGIVDPSTSRADPQSAVRMRHADFAAAQKLIVEELRSITAKTRDLKTQITAARQGRNKLQAAQLARALRKEEFKETIIRKLADSIAWQLIDGRSDFVQWLHFYEEPPAIDESNLLSVLAKVNELNQSDPLSFALITDLTSFVQVGDILRRDRSAFIKLIEVKEGKENKKAMRIAVDELTGEADESGLARLTSIYGPDLTKQARRIRRQLTKSERVREIINTGDGADPKTGTRVMVREPQAGPATYAGELAEQLLRLDETPWAYTVIEDCLMIGCYKGLMKREGVSLLSSLAQTLFGDNFVTVNFRDGLQEPMCEPIFLKQFREDDIFDIVFNRTSVSLILNLDQVIETFRERGGTAYWLSRKETAKLVQQSGSKYERPFVFKGNNRAIALENDKWHLFVGDGSLRRIFFDSVLPSSVISMLLDALNSQL